MPSLSDKLKSLGVNVGARNLPQPPKRVTQVHPIEQVVAGQFQSTDLGSVFVTEQPYDMGYRHGRVGLWPEASLQMMAVWAKEARLTEIELAEFAFLDTETSGLAGGTGTYAFLVGVGRFEGDDFRVAQFFMQDPGEESAQLTALTDFLAPCQALVTFNGKSFDGPLLNTRYTLNGMSSPLPALAHLDLLPLARRLWRDRLPSRRLADLETQILGLTRTEEDVPGWLIPSIYFDYLRGGDARPLKGVFYHNALDILAMAALMNQMAQMLTDPLGEAIEYALDLVAVGKLYEALGHIDMAAELMTTGMSRNDLPEVNYWDTQRRLSLLHKRHNNLSTAVDLWQLAAEGRQIYAHVELAKYYEHKQHDFPEAARWTQTALNLLATHNVLAGDRREWLSDLKYRLARLQRKMEK